MNKQLIFKYIKYHAIPYILTFCLFMIVGCGKWTEFKQPITLYWIIFTTITIFVMYYSNYKYKFEKNCKYKSRIKKYKNLSLNILSIVATVVAAISYTPSMGQIIVAIILILIATLFFQIAPKYNIDVPATIFSIAVIGIIVFSMHYQVSYPMYSEKINEALENFRNNDVSLEQIENILEDKYFKSHYSDDLLPIAVSVRSNICNDEKDSKHLSTSVSTPRFNGDECDFVVSFYGTEKISFEEEDIFINGFNAHVEIEDLNMEKNRFHVRLKDISGYSGKKRFRILGGVTGLDENKASLMTPESISFKYINPFEIVILSIMCLSLVIATNILFILSLHKGNNND